MVNSEMSGYQYSGENTIFNNVLMMSINIIGGLTYKTILNFH